MVSRPQSAPHSIFSVGAFLSLFFFCFTCLSTFSAGAANSNGQQTIADRWPQLLLAATAVHAQRCVVCAPRQQAQLGPHPQRMLAVTSKFGAESRAIRSRASVHFRSTVVAWACCLAFGCSGHGFISTVADSDFYSESLEGQPMPPPRRAKQ